MQHCHHLLKLFRILLLLLLMIIIQREIWHIIIFFIWFQQISASVRHYLESWLWKTQRSFPLFLSALQTVSAADWLTWKIILKTYLYHRIATFSAHSSNKDIGGAGSAGGSLAFQGISWTPTLISVVFPVACVEQLVFGVGWRRLKTFKRHCQMPQ